MQADWPFRYSVTPPPPAGAVLLPAEQLEQALLERLAAAKEDPRRPMWELAQFYKRAGKPEKAMECLRRLLESVDDLEKRAEIILALGQSAEVMRDYGLAVNFYRHALAHEPTDKTIWFFIHNNLGYSLMQLADFAEAEKFCRAATQIDPGRPNGHKNLGLAFQGQGRSREAAACFVAATQANAADARALGHLEALLAAHPELAAEFGAQLECCRQAVAVAREANAQAEAAWKRPPG